MCLAVGNCRARLVSPWVVLCHQPPRSPPSAFPSFSRETSQESRALPARCSGGWRLRAARRFGAIPGQQNAEPLTCLDGVQGSKTNTRKPRAGRPLVQAAGYPLESSFPPPSTTSILPGAARSALSSLVELPEEARAPGPALPPRTPRFCAGGTHQHQLRTRRGAAGLSCKQPRCQMLLQ